MGVSVKYTKNYLAYVANTPHCMLFKPGDGSLQEFEKKHGHPMAVGTWEDQKVQAMGAGLFWFVHFHHAVVRDGVDPVALNKTMLQIPEFRRHCCHDVPGMDKYKG